MKDPIVVEKTYDAPIEQVWLALTNKEEMKEWYFNPDEFKPEVGFTFSFSGEGSTGEKYMHHCEILEVIPMQKLKHTWEYEGHKGKSTVTFALASTNGKTKLTLTHEGVGTFPKQNKDFTNDSFHKGWNTILGELLPKFLKNN